MNFCVTQTQQIDFVLHQSYFGVFFAKMPLRELAPLSYSVFQTQILKTMVILRSTKKLFRQIAIGPRSNCQRPIPGVHTGRTLGAGRLLAMLNKVSPLTLPRDGSITGDGR